MNGPIVFISHFHVKEGQLDALRALTSEVVAALDRDRPRTLAYLAYFDTDATGLTIVHVFGDQEAMDLHFEGANERSRAAYQYMEPRGWEIYGSPSDTALETMRAASASTGAPLTVRPAYTDGFLRA